MQPSLIHICFFITTIMANTGPPWEIFAIMRLLRTSQNFLTSEYKSWFSVFLLIIYRNKYSKENFLLNIDFHFRGKRSLETICLMLAYKIKFPNNFFLLRGNHECASINRYKILNDDDDNKHGIQWLIYIDLKFW